MYKLIKASHRNVLIFNTLSLMII